MVNKNIERNDPRLLGVGLGCQMVKWTKRECTWTNKKSKQKAHCDDRIENVGLEMKSEDIMIRGCRIYV